MIFLLREVGLHVSGPVVRQILHAAFMAVADDEAVARNSYRTVGVVGQYGKRLSASGIQGCRVSRQIGCTEHGNLERIDTLKDAVVIAHVAQSAGREQEDDLGHDRIGNGFILFAARSQHHCHEKKHQQQPTVMTDSPV